MGLECQALLTNSFTPGLALSRSSINISSQHCYYYHWNYHCCYRQHHRQPPPSLQPPAHTCPRGAPVLWHPVASPGTVCRTGAQERGLCDSNPQDAIRSYTGSASVRCLLSEEMVNFIRGQPGTEEVED